MTTSAPVPDRTALAYWITAFVVVLVGLALRILPSATVKGVGFDELLYRGDVQKMEVLGLFDYGKATDLYLEGQRKPGAKAELPPTRFLYIFSGYVWKSVLHGDEKALNLMEVGAFRVDPYLRSLRGVSTLFSVLTMLLGGVIACRLAGRGAGLAVLALMACAPLQIHMSQHAMIDGFFAFWAMLGMWSLWESLQQPGDRRWLALYALSLFCMVLTKENAFFVFVALCGLLVVGRWAGWGTATRALWLVTFIAPACALLVLIALAGGIGNFVETYRLLVANAQHLDYAIETGDGPWYRYLVDLMVLSPAVLCLAIAAAFHSWREERWVPYVLGFVAFTYLIMCNIRYGMNLRYATIWDLPLCLLAFAQLARSARGAGAWARYVLPALVGLLCLHELNQYRVFFNQSALYELGPADLLNAVKILK
jgi:4-amino-4-deoxy-L-arabinose transferase-like glycosyltransferase